MSDSSKKSKGNPYSLVPDGAVLEAKGLVKSFTEVGGEIRVLNNVDFAVQPGESVAIVGASGAGKSSLLHILGGLDMPTGGHVAVNGQRFDKLSNGKRGRLRNASLGFVYQFHHLLPEFTALENVAMPLLIGKRPIAEARERATEVLTRVGLSERLQHKPSELSGGERQRAAVARALVTQPRCVLADEPTGNLDAKNAAHILGLMLELNSEFDTALIVVTHDEQLAGKLGRQLRLHNGLLQPL